MGRDFLRTRPTRRYPATKIAPESESRSPSRGFAPPEKSPTPMAALPEKARTKPRTESQGILSRRNRNPNRAAKMGWVATMTTEQATLVRAREDIQVAKCRARKRPERRRRSHSRD